MVWRVTAATPRRSDDDVPSLHPIHLQIHPPDAWNAEHEPQHAIVDRRANGQVLEEDKVQDRDDDDKGRAQAKEEAMDGRPQQVGWRGRHGEEGRYGGACGGEVVSGTVAVTWAG